LLLKIFYWIFWVVVDVVGVGAGAVILSVDAGALSAAGFDTAFTPTRHTACHGL
jgi:hypothetical protein